MTDTNWVDTGEVWVTNGTLDVMAHYHHGKASMSARSRYNYPNTALARLADTVLEDPPGDQIPRPEPVPAHLHQPDAVPGHGADSLVANHVGHSSITMIQHRYGKWIHADGQDVPTMIEKLLDL